MSGVASPISAAIAAAVLLLVLALCAGPLVFAIRARHRIRIAASAVWLLISVVPLSALAIAFAIPYLTFWAARARCSHQPVIASAFAASHSYDLPGDHDYGPSFLTSRYFCSETQAEQAGYRRGLGRIK